MVLLGLHLFQEARTSVVFGHVLTHVLVELSGSTKRKSCIIRNAMKLEFQIGDCTSVVAEALQTGTYLESLGA